MGAVDGGDNSRCGVCRRRGTALFGLGGGWLSSSASSAAVANADASPLEQTWRRTRVATVAITASTGSLRALKRYFLVIPDRGLRCALYFTACRHTAKGKVLDRVIGATDNWNGIHGRPAGIGTS